MADRSAPMAGYSQKQLAILAAGFVGLLVMWRSSSVGRDRGNVTRTKLAVPCISDKFCTAHIEPLLILQRCI